MLAWTPVDAASDLPIYSSLRDLAGRYDRRSLVVLAGLIALHVAIGKLFPENVVVNIWMVSDRLVAGIWIAMYALLAWDIRPRRDLSLLLGGFVGGFLIESWGTTTELWWYHTRERPPVWILHAWPIAALAIDRLGRVFTAVLPERYRGPDAYWTVFPAFLMIMLLFMWPSFGVASSWLALLGMVLAMLWRPMHSRDLCIFFGGSFLGIFIEYWSTTRTCWVYYTLQVPPPAPILAHGFASVIFSRGVQALDALIAGWRARSLAALGGFERPLPVPLVRGLLLGLFLAEAAGLWLYTNPNVATIWNLSGSELTRCVLANDETWLPIGRIKVGNYKYSRLAAAKESPLTLSCRTADGQLRTWTGQPLEPHGVRVVLTVGPGFEVEARTARARPGFLLLPLCW